MLSTLVGSDRGLTLGRRFADHTCSASPLLAKPATSPLLVTAVGALPTKLFVPLVRPSLLGPE